MFGALKGIASVVKHAGKVVPIVRGVVSGAKEGRRAVKSMTLPQDVTPFSAEGQAHSLVRDVVWLVQDIKQKWDTDGDGRQDLETEEVVDFIRKLIKVVAKYV